MTDQGRRPDVVRGSSVVHFAIVCGLLLLGVIAFSFIGPGWGTALILVALILCPLMLIAIARAGDSDRWSGLGKPRRG